MWRKTKLKKLGEFEDNINEFLNNIDKIERDITEIVQEQVADDLNNIFKWRIDEFYNSYKPHRYKRTKSLYKVYEITYNNGIIRWDFDSKYMDEEVHRVSNEYIFQNSFMKGYHGGAPYINNLEQSVYKQPHPQPGVPYWRTPVPDGIDNPYNFWYTSAKQMLSSPYDRIQIDLSKYNNNKDIKPTKGTAGKSVNLKESVNWAIWFVLGDYKLFQK